MRQIRDHLPCKKTADPIERHQLAPGGAHAAALKRMGLCSDVLDEGVSVIGS